MCRWPPKSGVLPAEEAGGRFLIDPERVEEEAPDLWASLNQEDEDEDEDDDDDGEGEDEDEDDDELDE